MRYSNFLSTVSNRASLSITQTLYDRRALDCSSSRPLVNSLHQLMILTGSSGRVRETLCSDGGLERIVQIMKDCNQGEADTDLAAYKWHLSMQCLLNLGARGSENVRKRILEAGAIPVIATVLDNYLVAHGDSLEHRDRDRVHHTHRHTAPSMSTAASGSTAGTNYTASSGQSGAQPNAGYNPVVANSSDMPSDVETSFASRTPSASSGVAGPAPGPVAQTGPAGLGVSSDTTRPAPATVLRSLSIDTQDSRDVHDHASTQESADEVSDAMGDAMGDAVSDAVGGTEDMRMAMRAGLFLTQFTQATGQPVNRISRDQQGDQAVRLPSAMRESTDVEAIGMRIPQFMNGILVPREQDVCWALEIIAFVSKYSHLRREMHETHLLPKMSLRPHEDLFTCVYESDSSDMSSHSSMDSMDVDECLSHSSQSSLARAPVSGSFMMNEPATGMDKTRDYEAMYYAYDFENTVDFDEEYLTKPINLFELVERFTAFRWPCEFPHWACIIMRNVVRKDESKGGIRQCANFACGKWETSPRQFAKCRRCKRTKYCSKACQLKSWSMHRYWCAPANTGSSTSQSQQSDRQQDVNTNSPRAGSQGSVSSLQSSRRNSQTQPQAQHQQQQLQQQQPLQQQQQDQNQRPQQLVPTVQLNEQSQGGLLGAPLRNAYQGQPLQPFQPLQLATAPLRADGQASRADSDADGSPSPGTRQNSSVMLADP